MTTLGFILIGIIIGRLIGPAYWWVNILQLILALLFIIAGQLRLIRRTEMARQILITHIQHVPTQEDLHEWHKRGRQAQIEKREDNNE